MKESTYPVECRNLTVIVGDGIEWFIYQSTGKKAGYAEMNLF